MARTLGPFQIERFVASGAMGAVYLGFHALERYEAAIKVTPPPQNTRAAEAFLREVRATAALSHPGIVAVYDYGEVTDTESRASDSEFRTGGLWFAMELATRGTLERILPLTSWTMLRTLLMSVLDALAHAHARGVVHRDLKPANILVTDRDGATALMLADFGIAHVVDPARKVAETSDEFGGHASGTPRYMAPEQIRGLWRDFGPWTDLYSLACVSWELVTGQPVFQGRTAFDVALAHTREEPGAFVPRFPVPDGFEGWLRTLLQKPRTHRFQRAADAALALARLPEPAPFLDEASPARAVRLDPGVLAALPTLGDLDATITERLPSLHMRAVRIDDGKLAAPTFEAPPIPADWRATHPRTPRSRRTGLGLFGLREIALLGLEAERDALWNLLAQSARDGRPRAMIVEAAEGRGKSRLLRWMGMRAHELGAATVIAVTHTEMLGPAAGVPTALSRHIGCMGLPRDEVRERVTHYLRMLTNDPAHADAEALTELLSPRDDAQGRGSGIRFGAPSERYNLIARVLRLEAAQRPVLVLIDDAQWGPDALGLTRHILAAAPSTPFAITFVIAARPDLLAHNPIAQRRAEELRSRHSVAQIDLPSISREQHLGLIRDEVGLFAPLADELVANAGNDTNYSLCVVGDWVLQGTLRPTEAGYHHRLPTVEFPRDGAEAWAARLDRFCARFPIPSRVAEALEIAAALGAEVDEAEWRRACALRDVTPGARVIGALIDAGIAHRTDTGFAFARTPIIATLRDRAVTCGRWPRVHADCARAIVTGAQNGASAAERRAQHLLVAGEIAAALEELEHAVEARLATSAYEEAIALADAYLATRRMTDDEPALVMRARRANALRFTGDVVAAEVEAAAILSISRARHSPRGEGEGLRVLAGIEQSRGHHHTGIARYTEAISAYQAADDPLGVSRSVHGRGWLYLNDGRCREAFADFRLAAQLAAEVDSLADLAWSLQGLAEAATYVGELDRATQAAEEALERFRELGSRSGTAMTLTSRGNIERARANPAGARSYYLRAIDILHHIESPLVAFPLMHSVATEALHGDADRIREAVKRALAAELPPPFRVVVALGDVLAHRDAPGPKIEALAALARPGSAHPIVPELLSVAHLTLSAEDDARVKAFFGR